MEFCVTQGVDVCIMVWTYKKIAKKFKGTACRGRQKNKVNTTGSKDESFRYVLIL